MKESVKKVLQENVWNVATVNDKGINLVIVGFKNVLDDGRLVMGDIMMKTTVENIKANGKITVSAMNSETKESYQLQGSGVYMTEGQIYDGCKKKADDVFQGAVALKGIIVMDPEKTIVLTPGADNKKEL